jgi:hypothetical protein
VIGVSVWDHRPTADELLDARLASGWKPTPTGTVDGPVVLGHAACRIAVDDRIADDGNVAADKA